MNQPVLHHFTKSEIRQAEHEFTQMMKKHFGEIWTPKSDGEYEGKSWDCRSMVSLDAGLWRLVQEAKHTGTERVFGKIEVKDSGYLLRFKIFYQPVKPEPRIIQ